MTASVAKRSAVLATLALASECLAGGCSGVLHVHTRQGDDRSSGSAEAPLRSIQEAVSRVRPGETILLVPGQGPVHGSIKLLNRSGQPEAPLTLDGGGNRLTGCEPLDPSEWEEVGPDLYRNTTLLDRLAGGNPARRPFILKRFFLVENGKINRMGRSSKGALPALPAPEALAPGQWTGNAADGALHFRTAPGIPLSGYNLEIPVLQDGLSTRGDCSHWVVRNLHVMRFWNDGFNFHGTTKNFRLENVSASDCGDDGMSLHGQCAISVRNFSASGNSTGICHIEQSTSNNEAVNLNNNHGLNLFVLGTGTHVFAQSTIGRGIRAGSTEADFVTLRFVDCELPPVQDHRTPPVEQGPNSRVEIRGVADSQETPRPPSLGPD